MTYAETLEHLAKELKRRPMTARAVSVHFRCSRPIAYQRIQSLIKLGFNVTSRGVRESARGPCSVAYRIR